jgi:hypothetical protein
VSRAQRQYASRDENTHHGKDEERCVAAQDAPSGGLDTGARGSDASQSGEREGSQQQRVHDAEDGDVGRDAHGGRQDGGDAERGAASQRPAGVTDVKKEQAA